MKIKSLVIGWGEGASVYWASDKISIIDLSTERDDGTVQTYFHVCENGVVVRRIVDLPINVEFYNDCPLPDEEAKEADDE